MSTDPTSSENNQPPILIRSDRLTVEIAPPGSVYRGTRFDWTGFITQVTLDGAHTFCVPESLELGRGTGGIGLCNEFGNEKPVGYAEAQPGDVFPKLGIGLLKRPDGADYNFFRAYEICKLFPVSVETAPGQARFLVEPVDCRGYAVRLTKTVSVQGNQLQIAYQLENAGCQPVVTHEYCHNFIGIDRQPIGPDYSLRFPYPVELEKLTQMLRGMVPPILRRILPVSLLDKLTDSLMKQRLAILEIDGEEIHFRDIPKDAFYCRLQGFTQTRSPQWELVHLSRKMGIRETDDFAPARVAVWGTTHVVSAEVFIDINLQPGEMLSWTRRYEFLTFV